MNWISEEHVRNIIQNHGQWKDVGIEKYIIHQASDKMLGFLADYWKLKVFVSFKTGDKKMMSFFIKAVSQNDSKADMVKEMGLFDKEINFYTIIKNNIELPGIKPWSAKLVSTFNEAIIFEDMNALGYKSQNKFETFNDAHTKQALNMLARFHASSIIYEQKKRKVLQTHYSINEEFEIYLDKGGYYDSNVWFVQCMKGALEATKKYSKYKDHERISIIESRWRDIWSSALDLSNASPRTCNVVCHRDLWNNNLLFHYKNVDDDLEPDDCVMVDFQAVRCQPPAGDVMLLLYCNLKPNFREENMDIFLRYYYQELEVILFEYEININNVLPLQEFLISAEEQRLWALVVSACLIPQLWLDDDLTTDIFCDTKQFHDILSNDKASFIIRMVEANQQYKNKVMQIFEEIVERYCLV